MKTVINHESDCRLFGLALILLLASMVFCSFGCGDLEEQHEDVPDIQVDDDDDDDDTGDGWDYPYYLVIGGGLSETLSLLTINGPDSFSLANDVQVTSSSINQTVVYEKELYAVCSLSHSVMVYDVHDLSISRQVSVGIGNNPMMLAFHEDKKAFIANFLSNDVTYYDLADDDGDALYTIAMPSGDELPTDGDGETWARPGGLIMAAGKAYAALSNLDGAYVAGGPGLVAVIDPESKSVDSIIEMEGRDTVGVYARDDDLVYVISAGDYEVGEGFVGNGKVELIDTQTDEIVGSVETGGAPFEMVINSDNVAYLGNGAEGVVLSFDAETHEMLDPIDIRDPDDTLGLSYASALVVDGNGYLYAAEFNHDRLFVIDTMNQNKIVATFTVNDGPDTLSFIR
ncbi:MAG TPA: hypothetical protein PKW95_15750 [bacterium]|nr:hypothetical protein [bacterium]